MKSKVFEQIYDLLNYKNYYKYYDRFSYIMFIKHLIKNLRIYITHYSTC